MTRMREILITIAALHDLPDEVLQIITSQASDEVAGMLVAAFVRGCVIGVRELIVVED